MLRKTVIGVTALLAGYATIHQPAPTPQQRGELTERSLYPWPVQNEPGVAIMLRSAGRIVFQHCHGVRRLDSNAPINLVTNFRLASLTKQFTAMAIMLLIHDGKLSYEQTLASIWPNFPDYGKAITVRQLLNHTSGLPDYEDLMEAAEESPGPRWSAEKQIQDQEVLQLLEGAPHGKFLPGTSWSYSNSGYVVLGLIVSKVSGIFFPEFLRARIFAPLHMDNTVLYVRGKNEVTNRAYGHTKNGDSFRETDQSATSATLGDGGIYSNLIDLAKWDDALQKHTLLSAGEMQVALRPATLANGSQTHWPNAPGDENLYPGKPVFYGFGWFLDPYEHNGSHPRMWHYGSTMGFRTAIERYTKQPLTVIVLCNRTDLDPQELAHRIADQYPPLK